MVVVGDVGDGGGGDAYGGSGVCVYVGEWLSVGVC